MPDYDLDDEEEETSSNMSSAFTSEAAIGSYAGLALGFAFILFLAILSIQVAISGFCRRRRQRRSQFRPQFDLDDDSEEEEEASKDEEASRRSDDETFL